MARVSAGGPNGPYSWMQIGVVYPQTELRGDPSAVQEVGLAVERLGFDHLLAYDLETRPLTDPRQMQPINEKKPLPGPLSYRG
jgi:hypothetical protein